MVMCRLPMYKTQSEIQPVQTRTVTHCTELAESICKRSCNPAGQASCPSCDPSLTMFPAVEQTDKLYATRTPPYSLACSSSWAHPRYMNPGGNPNLVECIPLGQNSHYTSPTCPAAAVLQLDLTMQDPRLDPVLPLSIRARVWGLGVTLKQRGGLHFGIHRPTGITKTIES